MTQIGFIGLGDMGLPIAARLQAMLGPITVWNRTTDKSAEIVSAGTRLASSPRSLAAECGLIGLCLTSDLAVEEVVFGEQGLLSGPARGFIIVNLSTGTPDNTRSFAERTASAGVQWLDAPMSGGVPAARAGTLTLFLGGEQTVIEDASPLIEAISTHRTRVGAAGAGQATKLCNQMIVATNLLAIAQAFAVARGSGIDVSYLAEALSGGFGDSTPLRIFGPRMAAHRYEPRLGAIALMLKDVEAAATLASSNYIPTPLLDQVVSIYRSISQCPAPRLDQDLAALIELFEFEEKP